jgi:putative YhbY family RNA-binding protein
MQLMPELDLTRDDRVALKARAHHLDPVVRLGAAGLSDAVLREIDRALSAHALIKIRVPSDDRDDRSKTFELIADRLSAGRVAIIGKMLVLYRHPEEVEPAEPPARSQRYARDRSASRSPSRAATPTNGRPGPAPHGAAPRRRRI